MATHIDESLISIPRQRRVKCDETLPTCQRCESSGRVCKGLWVKTSIDPQTLASSNISPDISTECNRSSAEAEPPLNSPDSENPQRIEPDWAEGSAASNQRGRIAVELRACQAGVEKGQTKDFIWVEEPEGKNAVLGKRKANTASLPESRVKAISKRSRSNDDEQKVRDLIIVSSEDYIQAGKEDEYPNSVPNSPQISNDAVRKARMALLAVDESSAPVDSKIELDCASPYSPSCNDEGRQLRTIEHSIQPRNDLDDSPLCLSQERSNLSAPTSTEQDRPSSVPLSVPLNTTHALGKSWKAGRSSSSARNSQPGSLHNISPPPDDTHHLENSNNDESLHAPNQTPTQATDDPTGFLKAYSSSNMSMPASKYQRGELRLYDAPEASRAGSHMSSPALVPQAPSDHQLPAITFTIDNRIQTLLPVATIESAIEIFSRNCAVLPRPQKMLAQDQLYPIDVVIWRHAHDFYNWFKGEMCTPKISILVFELYNAKGKLGKAFSVAVGDSYHFQMAKQYIWDSFWAASKFNNGPTPLKILITPAPHQALPHAAGRNAMVPMPSTLLEGHSTATKLGNSGAITDSRPQVHDGLLRLRNEASRYLEHPQPLVDFSSLDGAAPREYQPRDAPRGPITALLPPEITVRLQKNGAGKVSGCYNKWVLGPDITTTDFFAWFASETGRGGDEGPPSLRFTFKDAMPTPTSCTITKANEDHFNLIKRDLKTQYESAREFVPSLKEFCVLVADPGWVSEEDW
ncbi:hypothetical protein B0J14DRAFT_692210 [Halenospora varia]|nr:hypothetical protein B0J14DRAFT_692210 [Halenospora varia]